MDRDFWKKVRYNIFVSKRYRVLYVSTPKAACTSMKWWFADLEGRSDLIRMYRSSLQSDVDFVVHDAFPKVAPDVTGLRLHSLEEPLASDEYFRFAVVRNPYKRIFSAWQSKFLLREPLQVDPYVDCEFFKREINSLDDIALAFEGFLEHIAANEAPYFFDPHWVPQAELIRPDLINYTMVAKVENLRELSSGLAAHIRAGDSDIFEKYRSNESLIPYLPRLVTERASELILSLYREDFTVFGYPTCPPSAKEEFSDAEFRVALKAVHLIRGRHQRLEDIRTQALTWRLRKRLRLLKREYLGKIRARMLKQATEVST